MVWPVLFASILAAAQPAPPAPASYILYDSAPRVSGIERLLETWTRVGAARLTNGGGDGAVLRQCFERPPSRRVDTACVRRHMAAGPRRAPSVAILTRDSGLRNHVLLMTCVGPSGVDGTRVDVSRGPFSGYVRLANQAREGIARCLNTALAGAVRFQPLLQAPGRILP